MSKAELFSTFTGKPLFLKIGVTLASFKADGKWLLIISERILERLSETQLRIGNGILKEPDAFFNKLDLSVLRVLLVHQVCYSIYKSWPSFGAANDRTHFSELKLSF